MRNKSNAVAAVGTALTAYIQPLLPGTIMSGPFSDAVSRSLTVCYDTQHRLRVYIAPERKEYFEFKRKLPFTEEERLFVERIICETDAPGRRNAPLCTLMAEAVERAVLEQITPGLGETVGRIIKIYEKWNEPCRKKLMHTTGIRLMRHKKEQGNFFDLVDTGLIKPLDSSPDTLVVIDDKGGSPKMEKMVSTAATDRTNQEVFAPFMYADIAAWSNSRRKAAVSLAEDGTILLFSMKRLLFVKHGTRWHSLPHTLINLDAIPESIDGIEPEMVKALYLTALDMAAGNSNAHIGLVRSFREMPLQAGRDKAELPLSCGALSKNARLLSQMTDGKRFSEIPRVIRAEICALGEMLLLDGKGNLLGLELPGKDRSAVDALPVKKESEGRAFPGKAYMELFNTDGRFNLRLDIY